MKEGAPYTKISYKKISKHKKLHLNLSLLQEEKDKVVLNGKQKHHETEGSREERDNDQYSDVSDRELWEKKPKRDKKKSARDDKEEEKRKRKDGEKAASDGEKKKKKQKKDKTRAGGSKEEEEGGGEKKKGKKKKQESLDEEKGVGRSREELSDVSDREMVEEEEETREVRLRDLSVSPINSDQSESFEKAATLGTEDNICHTCERTECR